MYYCTSSLLLLDWGQTGRYSDQLSPLEELVVLKDRTGRTLLVGIRYICSTTHRRQNCYFFTFFWYFYFFESLKLHSDQMLHVAPLIQNTAFLVFVVAEASEQLAVIPVNITSLHIYHSSTCMCWICIETKLILYIRCIVSLVLFHVCLLMLLQTTFKKRQLRWLLMSISIHSSFFLHVHTLLVCYSIWSRWSLFLRLNNKKRISIFPTVPQSNHWGLHNANLYHCVYLNPACEGSVWPPLPGCISA